MNFVFLYLIITIVIDHIGACNQQEQQRRKYSLQYLSRPPPGNYFGVNLLKLCTDEKPLSPVLTLLIPKIENFDLGDPNSHGLYRQAGNANRMKSLREKIDNATNDIELQNIDFSGASIHTLARLMTKYLNELPSAIINEEATEDLLKIEETDQDKKIDQFRYQLNRHMGYTGYENLHYVCVHLEKVAAQSAVNDMTYKNLAQIFAMTLMRTPAVHDPEMHEKYKEVMLFILEHQKEIFGDVPTKWNLGTRKRDVERRKVGIGHIGMEHVYPTRK